MILVTGATGTVGRCLVERLVEMDAPVRALTRDPGAAHLPDRAEVVRGDLGDLESLAAAVRGVDRAFLLSTGPEIPVHDANLAQAAARAGVRHVVKLSSGRTGDATATDPIPSWHRLGEEAVRESGVPWTILGPLGFMANTLHWAGTIRTQGAVYAAYSQGRIAAIDERDIAAVAAAVLTTSGHEGQTYRLSGPEPISVREQTEILADVLGRELRFVEIEPAAARQAIMDYGVPTEMADAIMALRATALEAFTSVVHPTVQELTGAKPATYRQWAERNINRF